MVQWQEFLQLLDAHFEALRDKTDALPLAVAAERAAADLLPLVIERTHCEDAWYATFTLVLKWFLESTGLDP